VLAQVGPIPLSRSCELVLEPCKARSVGGSRASSSTLSTAYCWLSSTSPYQ